MLALPLVLLATACGGALAHPSGRRDVSVTLPLVSELNLAHLANVAQLDQARAAALMQRLFDPGEHRRDYSTSVDATNTAVRSFIVSDLYISSCVVY